MHTPLIKSRSQNNSRIDSNLMSQTLDNYRAARSNAVTPSNISILTATKSKSRPSSTPITNSIRASPVSSQKPQLKQLLDTEKSRTVEKSQRASAIFNELYKERRNSLILVKDSKEKIARLENESVTPSRRVERSSSLYLRDEIEKVYKPNVGVIYAKRSMNNTYEKKYKFMINILENLEHEKKHANEVKKYIFDRPFSRNSETQAYYEKLISSTPISSPPPISARSMAPDQVEVEKIRPESVNEYRDMKIWTKYNNNQLKFLKKNINMVQRRKDSEKRVASRFIQDNGEPPLSAILSPNSTHKKFFSKDKSVEKRLQFNHKLTDLLRDYPKGNPGINSTRLSVPRFAIKPDSADMMAKSKRMAFQIDTERIEESKQILKGPNFRDALDRINKKLQRRASVQQLSSRSTKDELEKAITEKVKNNKLTRHIRSISPPTQRDKIFIDHESALSQRSLKISTARPSLDTGEVPKSMADINEDLKKISSSCDKFLMNSTLFNNKMKRRAKRLKKKFNKMDHKMEGGNYPIDREIKKQIVRDANNPIVYLTIKREENRRRPDYPEFF